MRHHDIHHGKIGPQFRRIEETLIRIEHRGPVSIHMRKRSIACGGKIVLPCEIINSCPCTFCQRPHAVRRPGINHDAFICIGRGIFKPALHILTVIACKDACCNADLMCVGIDTLPDLRTALQLRSHLIRKKGLFRSRGGRQLQCRRSCLNCRAVTMKCSKSLRILRMHFRQLRECLHCLPCNIEVVSPPHWLHPIDTQQNTPAAARIDDTAPSECHIFACVVLRMMDITQIVISLREIAPNPLRLLCLSELCQQNAQIAFSFLTCKHGRVPRVHESQKIRSDRICLRCCTIRITQLFMNVPDVVSPCTAAENPRCIRVKQCFTRHLINIVPGNEKHLTVIRVGHLDRRAKIPPRLRGEIFICIDEYDPIARHVGKCRVARRSKVICPCRFVHSRSIGFRCSYGIIARPRIDNDECIHGSLQALD